MVSKEIKIDGRSYSFEKIENLKVFLEQQGITGYGLCHSPAIISSARCELCLVRVDGKIVRSCEYFINDTIDVVTEDEELNNIKSSNFELLANDHSTDCERCHQNGLCQLQKFSRHHHQSFPDEKKNEFQNEIEDLARGYQLDHGRCINCSLCVDYSKKIYKDGLFSKKFRGKYTKVSFNKVQLEEVDLGKYRDLCPTGAIYHNLDKRIGTRSQWSSLECHGCDEKCLLDARTIDQRFIDIRSQLTTPDKSCEAGRLWWQNIDFWKLNSMIYRFDQNGDGAPLFLEEVDQYLPSKLKWSVYLPSDLYQSEVQFWKKYEEAFDIKILNPLDSESLDMRTPKGPVINNEFKNIESLESGLEGVILVEPFWKFNSEFIDMIKKSCKYLIFVSFGDSAKVSCDLQVERISWMSEYKLLPTRQNGDFEGIIDLIKQKARN
ncbi:MAG: hypothetical protein COW01_12120 [Bdellovibrionales bacterium CG12_big_fil_rev_8_21_14_0_65_38_15]|nr:MAG: hypothetical protein COW79_01120 [Bdellovibrionales bacterium CG22_combo_CG10-13_8_21_14_all_38_13]PIQ54077.1 MAG: hypothetical protein COW01_12120 [Bdellovibrionales bacterium CG12_big_fil_rev_8_21_14_0_65_38_15]PIR28602.1 MAG: hypothetical protein COV38_15120 [Bdellovibrionales bacterium CG11_big_fil_rev_8_21_14_0_20_38_13]